MNKVGIKRRVASALCAVLMVVGITGCGRDNGTITPLSREEGSGTRSAFSELVGVVDKDGNDITVGKAEITNSTSVIMQSVISNPNAIGYMSLGAISKEVKVLKVDGVAPSEASVKDGKYKIARPFNIVTKKGMKNPLAEDFIKYILSSKGQKIVESQGYIPESETKEYKKAGEKGHLTIAGSTSVAPVMEVLAEKYMEINKGVQIEVQQSGSSAGITAVEEDACDIGMASRELKASELEKGLVERAIAMDGIAVIVNKENNLNNISVEDIQKIYKGEITNWKEVK